MLGLDVGFVGLVTCDPRWWSGPQSRSSAHGLETHLARAGAFYSKHRKGGGIKSRMERLVTMRLKGLPLAAHQTHDGCRLRLDSQGHRAASWSWSLNSLLVAVRAGW
jgi:hypothetical protein